MIFIICYGYFLFLNIDIYRFNKNVNIKFLIFCSKKKTKHEFIDTRNIVIQIRS